MSSFFKRFITGILLLVIAIILYIVPPFYSSCTLVIILCEILITEWPRLAGRSLWLWALAPVYLFTPFYALIALNQHEQMRPLFALVLIICAAHDTGSYLVGNLIGRHRIAPIISPGKTWEGFFGGLIITMAVLWALAKYFNREIPLYLFITITVALCTLAFLGDLFESWLKRKAGIKDSGSILPGHGGFLDRFDSIIFVSIAIYVSRYHLAYLLDIL